jgi:hypothetical protein
VRHHWYKPSYWRWWWRNRSIDAKALILICAFAVLAGGGYLAVAALPDGGLASASEVLTTEIVRGKVRIVTISRVVTANGRTRTIGKPVYRTVAGQVETLPARTAYATVTQRSGVVTVSVRGKPVTTEITRNSTVVTPVTVSQRQLVTTQKIVAHLVTQQQTVTTQQTLTGGGRTVTTESTVTEPITRISTTTSTVVVTTTVPVTTTVSLATTVPVTTTVSVTTTLPGATITRTVTVATPGATTG